MNPRRPSRSGFAGGNGPPAGQTLRRAGEGRTAGCTQFAGAPLSAPGHSFRGPVRRAVSSRSARRGGKKTFDVFVESAHSLLVLICREGRRYECRKAASFAGPTADGVPAGAGVSVARRTGNRAGSAGRSSPPPGNIFSAMRMRDGPMPPRRLSKRKIIR